MSYILLQRINNSTLSDRSPVRTEMDERACKIIADVCINIEMTQYIYIYIYIFQLYGRLVF